MLYFRIRHNPEGHNPNCHRRENLRFHVLCLGNHTVSELGSFIVNDTLKKLADNDH